MLQFLNQQKQQIPKSNFYTQRTKFLVHFLNMNRQLKVDVINTNRSKNSFGNSFIFNQEGLGDNEFAGMTQTKAKNNINKDNKDDIIKNNLNKITKQKLQQKQKNESKMKRSKVFASEQQQQQQQQDQEQQQVQQIKYNKKDQSKNLGQQQDRNKNINVKKENQSNVLAKNFNTNENTSKMQQSKPRAPKQKFLHQVIQIQQNTNENKTYGNNKSNLANGKNHSNQNIDNAVNSNKNNKFQTKVQDIKHSKNKTNQKGNLNYQQENRLNQKEFNNIKSREKQKNNNQVQRLQKDKPKIEDKKIVQKVQKNKLQQNPIKSPQQSNKSPQQKNNAKNISVKQPVKNDKQSKKIYQIKNNITQLNNSIKDIKQNYKDIQKIDAQDYILFRKNDRVKQMQIRQFLTNKRLQKQRRQKKIQQIRQRQKQQINKTIEVAELDKKRQKQQKLKRIKQLDYVEPKVKKQAYKQKQEEGRKLAVSLIQKYKHHQPYHIKKQKQDQQKYRKIRQQEQQILMQRKQRYQSLDLQQLQDHKKLHDERIQELQNEKKQRREDEWNKIMEDNNLMKDHIWKGPSHDIVDDERLEIKRKRKEPKEKVSKMKNYYEYIKKNFLPKTHQPKRSSPIHNGNISQSLGNYAGKYHAPDDEILAHYDPNKKHIKKYKYFQGNAIGEIVQSVPVARSYSQQKKIGQGYLQYLKNLPKKRQQSESTTEIDSQDLQMINRKFNSISKVKRQSVPFYQNASKKRTIQLSSKPTKQQVKVVIQRLKNEDVKLKSKKQLIRAIKHNSSGSYDIEKQLNTNMVLNMERKLDLLAKL